MKEGVEGGIPFANGKAKKVNDDSEEGSGYDEKAGENDSTYGKYRNEREDLAETNEDDVD